MKPDVRVRVTLICDEVYVLGILDVPPNVTLDWGSRKGPTIRVYNPRLRVVNVANEPEKPS